MPRSQNCFSAIHIRSGKVIHRRLRRAMCCRAPRRRLNNFGKRIRHEEREGRHISFWIWDSLFQLSARESKSVSLNSQLSTLNSQL